MCLHSSLAVDSACWCVRTAVRGTNFPHFSVLAAVFSNVHYYIELTSAEETQNLTRVRILQQEKAVKERK